MNTTEKFLIDVLRCFATGTQTEFNIEGIDTDQLLVLSKSHNVSGIVSYVLERCNAFKDESTRAKFAKEYDRTLMQMLSRESSAHKLCDEFTRMGIPHIMFKGMTVSEAYPIGALRAFGDVDIIVHKEDVSAICEFMIGEGFEHALTDEGVVNTFKRGREKYEIHTALGLADRKEYAFFLSIWENAMIKQGQTYVFNHNFHLCYLISHLEKHVYGSGTGVRLYLDIALYLKKYSDCIDINLVRENLIQCGLSQFFDTVLYLCNRWFDMTIPAFVKPLDENLYEQMCEFVFSGGVFGRQGKGDIMSDDLRREMVSGKKFAKLRFLLSRIFPSSHELCRMHPRFQDKPLLLPVAWFCHVWDVIRKGKMSNIKEIMKEDSGRAHAKKEFLDSIGSRR